MKHRVYYLCEVFGRLAIRNQPRKASYRFLCPEKFRSNAMGYLEREGIVEYKNKDLSETVTIQDFFLTEKGKDLMFPKQNN